MAYYLYTITHTNGHADIYAQDNNTGTMTYLGEVETNYNGGDPVDDNDQIITIDGTQNVYIIDGFNYVVEADGEISSALP